MKREYDDDDDVIERIEIAKKPAKEEIEGKIANYVIDFLSDLNKDQNNNKEWFNINRKRYEASKENFVFLIDFILRNMKEITPEISQTTKESVHRINKDIRFSIDRHPYRRYMAATFKKSGKKSAYAGYYFKVEPNGRSALLAGVFSPSSQILLKIRRGISNDYSPLRKVLEHELIVRMYFILK